MHLHSRAFFIDEAYGDVTVEFDYFASYSNNGQGNFGLILRAQDGGRFYYVHFPWGGQAYRAKHYWAGVGVRSGVQCGPRVVAVMSESPYWRRFLANTRVYQRPAEQRASRRPHGERRSRNAKLDRLLTC